MPADSGDAPGVTYLDELKQPLKRILVKILWMLQSRKFIGLVIGVFVVFGVVPEGQEGEANELYFNLIEAASAILAALGFAFTTAWEDVAKS